MSKVLIIEDEMIISFGYRLQLEQMGFDVIGTARSSEEALDLLATEPVIFMTASSDPAIVEGIRALQGCHYLLKPVDTDSLSGLLHATVRADA